MKETIKRFAILVILATLPFLSIQCDGSKEKADVKVSEVKSETAAKPEAAPAAQPNKKQAKSMLPKKLLDLGITDEQKALCEAAYQEIFTPDIIAQRKEMNQQLKGLEENSEQYLNLKKEINEKFKPNYAQFRVKLKEILTPEQQEQYFAKKGNPKKSSAQ
jgi:Spy/CpxP family protein refolding chaperone